MTYRKLVGLKREKTQSFAKNVIIPLEFVMSSYSHLKSLLWYSKM